MKINRIIVFGFILVCFIVYVSCRKNDQQSNAVSPGKTETRFFNEHQSANPLIQAAARFIKGENNKYHFVDKLTKQIGYPYWDKAIVTSANGGAGGKGASDSSNTIFIPFALDSQNVVNASLVITTSATDTSFHFLCDWQYTNRINGSMSVDTTAENLAALFMLLDNNVFGHTRFTLTDSTLFANLLTPPGATGREIVINNSQNNAGRSNIIETETVLICFYGYVCGTPTWCGNHGGCDYLNCPTGVCYATSTCLEFEVEEGTGGSGGTGPGGPGNPGSGGGGGTWNPPPPPCGPTSPGRNNVTACGPGWVPVEDNPGSVPEIVNNVDDPCLRSSVNEAINLDCKNKITTFVNTVFANSEQFHLQFHDVVMVGANANVDALTATGPLNSDPTQSMTIITLNNAQLAGASKEYIAATILHEVVHAWINYKFPAPVENAQQHYLMAEPYRLNLLRSVLMQMYPNLTLLDATDLTWGGLYNTVQFSNLPLAERQRIIQTNTDYKNGTKGTPC